MSPSTSPSASTARPMRRRSCCPTRSGRPARCGTRRSRPSRERFRVVRYDTRGHGGSPVPHGPYTLDDLGGDALALLDRLGVERAHVVGLSLGGMIGHVARRQRARARRSPRR